MLITRICTTPGYYLPVARAIVYLLPGISPMQSGR